MAGMNFEYDERGGTFYYFLVSFYALVLIPATYYLWPRSPSSKKDGSSEPKVCRCLPCQVKEGLKKSKEPWKIWKQRIINIFLLISWIGFAALAYKAAQVEVDHVEWDPYSVLGLDRGASIDQVKKAYRQLTKVHHPDKGGDEKRFVEITKAHLALTDEESKKNYDLYGNPDGPGAQTFGIALPSWLVSKEYSIWVLAVYGLIFMVILPTAVGIWWYKSIKYSADSVLMKTTELFGMMEHKTSLLNVKRVITIISGAYEFWKYVNKDVVERPSDNAEVPMLVKEFPNIGDNKREPPFYYPYSVKARALLYAHLSRRPLPPETLNKDLHYILRKCPYLIQELIQVYAQLYMYAINGRTLRVPALETLDNIIRVSPLIVQAMWESKSPLLQLPHFTDDLIRRCILKKKRNIKTCAALAAVPNEERRDLLRNLSDRQYQDVLNVLASMPRLEMDVTLEVKDDEDRSITAGAVVTVIIKLKRTPLLDPTSIRHHISSLNSNNNNSSSGQSRGHSANLYSSAVNHRDTVDVILNKSDAENDDIDEEHDHDMDDQDEHNLHNATKGAATANQQQQKNKQHKNMWEKPKKKKGGKNKQKQKQQQQKKQHQQPPAANKVAAKKQQENANHDEKAEKEHDDNASEKEDHEVGSSDEDAVKEALKDKDVSEYEDEDDFTLDEDFMRKEKILEAKSKITHLVHAPYFPEDKYEWWWVYLCDRKKRQFICPPTRVTTLISEEKVELHFPAQRVPGVYSIQVCLRSDSYVDCDILKEFKYTVQEAKQITSHPQWEFAEDEDKNSDDEVSEEASEYTEEEEEVSD